MDDFEITAEDDDFFPVLRREDPLVRRFTEAANVDLDLAFGDEPMAERSETSPATAVMLLGLALPQFSGALEERKEKQHRQCWHR